MPQNNKVVSQIKRMPTITNGSTVNWRGWFCGSSYSKQGHSKLLIVVLFHSAHDSLSVVSSQG